MFGLSAALYFRCTKTGSGGKFCVVSHSLTCGSLTLEVVTHCVGLGIWVPEYRIFVKFFFVNTPGLIPVPQAFL